MDLGGCRWGLGGGGGWSGGSLLGEGEGLVNLRIMSGGVGGVMSEGGDF